MLYTVPILNVPDVMIKFNFYFDDPQGRSILFYNYEALVNEEFGMPFGVHSE
jgi:hypothetical protein